jgi:hypothetical protein
VRIRFPTAAKSALLSLDTSSYWAYDAGVCVWYARQLLAAREPTVGRADGRVDEEDNSCSDDFCSFYLYFHRVHYSRTAGWQFSKDGTAFIKRY